MYSVSIKGDRIVLGRQGENLARRVPFSKPSLWREQFGEGKAELLHQRNSDEAPYPVVLTVENGVTYWNVSSTDTAIAGEGKCELRYKVGDTIVKSHTFRTTVLSALGKCTEEPPEAAKPWVDQVLEAAEKVEDATTHQPVIGDNGNWYVWDFETEAYIDTGVSASSGGGMTEEEVKKLLEGTAPKDHTHDVAGIYKTDISLFDLESETNEENVVIKAKSVDLGTTGTAKFYVSGHIRFITQGVWGVDLPTIKVDGKIIDSKEVGEDEFGNLFFAYEFDGDITESVELIASGSYTYVVFETLCKIEEKDGFMSAEQAEKLVKAPTTDEVNNLIAEAFGTVEAVFDEVHEYAESLGGDEA